jgi:hypothetical protein
MSKRFIDSELWEKPWYMELTPSEKLAWCYITTKCDAVGVWTPNFRLAEFIIGTQLDWDKFKEKCNSNIEVLADGKWFVVDYCEFQYGELKESCPPHRKYIHMLKNYGLYERVLKGYCKGINTLQEEEEEEEEEKEEYAPDILLTKEEYTKLTDQYEKKYVDSLLHRMSQYQADKNKTYSSHYRTALNWIKKDEKDGKAVKLKKKKICPSCGKPWNGYSCHECLYESEESKRARAL